MSELRHVVVIGGGLSGLSAAHRLIELRPGLNVSLLEAGPRLGGVLQSERRDGFLIERSADTFITNVPWGIDLCRRLGLEDQLLGTDPERRKAYVVAHGRLEPVPEGFVLMMPSKMWPMVTTPILSVAGKLRMMGEFFIPPRAGKEDESLQSFTVRRFGQEVFERLVQPLIGGIYTADPTKLSMQATMPRFLEMEREYGSIIRGAQRKKSTGDLSDGKSSGARYGMFVAPRDGMESIIAALAQKLPPGSIRLNTKVERLVRSGDRGWRIQTGELTSPLECDAVIVALPAPKGAAILQTVDGELAGLLERIPYAGASILVSAYKRSQIRHSLDGFGFVVPLVEERTILSCSFASLKYPGRAPEGTVLLRVFIGGACQSGLLQLSKSALIELAEREVAELLRIQGEPILRHIKRHTRAMPQYHVGHSLRVAKINRLLKVHPTLTMASNALSGVGVPACIESGKRAAKQLLAADGQEDSESGGRAVAATRMSCLARNS